MLFQQAHNRIMGQAVVEQNGADQFDFRRMYYFSHNAEIKKAPISCGNLTLEK
jgi:hypothetical protein